MYYGKVEICGVDTSKLTVLSDEEKRALLLASRNGDEGARQKLIDGNLRLVLSIIQRFTNRHENMDDLFQVGCIGLIKAVDNFNTDLDVKFSTYAVPMIIGETKKKGAEASLAEVAKEIGENETEISKALEAITEPVSLYEPIYNDAGDSLFVLDQISDTSSDDDAWTEDIALREALKKLSDRERNIINLRFYSGKTQIEIADEIGISQAQVSRLEKDRRFLRWEIIALSLFIFDRFFPAGCRGFLIDAADVGNCVGGFAKERGWKAIGHNIFRG